MDKLKEQLNEDMNDLYAKTIKETKYRPNYFREMLDELGGLETAKKLLQKEKVSDGFNRLWELKRLDLTVEAFIMDNKDKYGGLFNKDEITTAYERLKALGYLTNHQ